MMRCIPDSHSNNRQEVLFNQWMNLYEKQEALERSYIRTLRLFCIVLTNTLRLSVIFVLSGSGLIYHHKLRIGNGASLVIVPYQEPHHQLLLKISICKNQHSSVENLPLSKNTSIKSYTVIISSESNKSDK